MTMFLVIGPHCWGKGETQKKAYNKARSCGSYLGSGKRMPFVAYMYDTNKSPEVSVNAMWGNMEYRGERPVIVDAYKVSDEAMAEAKAYKESVEAVA